MPKGSWKIPMNVDLGPLAEKASRIRVRGGVVGKISKVLMFASIGFPVIAWSSGNVWLGAGCTAALFLLILILGWRMLDFADKNPHAALFEGSELLLHERMVYGMKGHPQITLDQPDASTNPDPPPKPLPLFPEADDAIERGGI